MSPFKILSPSFCLVSLSKAISKALVINLFSSGAAPLFILGIDKNTHIILCIFIFDRSAWPSLMVSNPQLRYPGDQLWPSASTRYSTASPLNGGVNDCEDEPAFTGL